MSYCTDLLYGQGLTLCFPRLTKGELKSFAFED